MGSNFNVEVARRVVTAGGVHKITDAVLRGTTFYALNAGASAIEPGMPVAIPPALSAEEASGSAPIWDLGSTVAIPKYVVPVVIGGGSNDVLIGVALDRIAPGEYGEIAGAGCFVPTSCEVNTGAPGDAVVAGSAAGTVTTVAIRPAPGKQLGIVTHRATPSAGTRSVTTLGVYVNPC